MQKSTALSDKDLKPKHMRNKFTISMAKLQSPQSEGHRLFLIFEKSKWNNHLGTS